jgi:uncharacterized protein YgbK (DUF1537 family)
MAVRPFGIAATLSDAVALAAAFGAGAKIGIGASAAASADMLAPASLTLQPEAANNALQAGRPQYIFTFGNTDASPPLTMIGPVMDLLGAASNTGFLCACLATPWLGRTVYQGHLFQNGKMQSDLKRDLAPYIDGAIAILPHQIVAGGPQAISPQLTGMKERGVRLALLDAIDEDQCGFIAEALARQPIIAGPAWISLPATAQETCLTFPAGQLAILSGALHRQTLLQAAAARAAMPVLDLDLSNSSIADQARLALAWSKTHFGEAPFMITTSAPPDRVATGAPAAEILGAIAQALAGAGIRNFLLNGNDTAAAVLNQLGISELTVSAPFAGLRWLRAQNLNILIKPGGFGSKNLFLYDFEPQSRLNESAE